MDLSYPDPRLGNGLLQLRPWDPADAETLAAAWADPAIQATCAVPAKRTVADATRWIDGHQRRIEAGLAVDLVISRPDGENKSLVNGNRVGGDARGEVGLGPFDAKRRAAVIGFWVAPECRGQGLASEAVGLVLDWTFSQGFAVVLAQTTTENLASIGVLRRSGFALHQQHGSTQTWRRGVDG